MPSNSDSNIATADALTLLLHNQHALGAAIEEVSKWLSEYGVKTVAENALVAMETLDTNAKAITACDHATAAILVNRCGQKSHITPRFGLSEYVMSTSDGTVMGANYCHPTTTHPKKPTSTHRL